MRLDAERLWWNAERFGLTPRKILSRLRDRPGPVVILNSLPKAGTHLLERAICQHPQLYRALSRTLHRRTLGGHDDRILEHIRRTKANQVLVTHLEYRSELERTLSELDIRMLFMIRDPRDIVVSQAHFIAGRQKHPFNTLFASFESVARYRLVIHGSAENGFAPIGKRLEAFAGWLTARNHVVRYEDLIGSEGGGSSDRQLATLAGIFDFLGLSISPLLLEKIAKSIFFTTSPTFRVGTVGQWRSQFDQETADEFTKAAGEISQMYGYAIE